MGLGTSIFLIAVGAILKFAVTTSVSGVNIATIGLILLIVGIVGLLISVFWMTVYADRRRGPGAGVPVDGPVVRERDVY